MLRSPGLSRQKSRTRQHYRDADIAQGALRSFGSTGATRDSLRDFWTEIVLRGSGINYNGSLIGLDLRLEQSYIFVQRFWVGWAKGEPSVFIRLGVD